MKKNLLKKTTVKTLSFLLLSISTHLFAQTPPIPDVLYYKFNEGISTSVTNYASAPPVGTASGTLIGAQTQTGIVNCNNALVGTGGSSSADYFNTGWAPSLTGSWSLSFVTSNITSSTTLYYIFGDVNTASWRCFTNGVAGAGNWILRGAGITDVLLTGAATASTSVSTFVYDATLNSISAYLNGVLLNTVAQATVSINGTGPFKIGAYSSNTGLPAGGLMTDFRLYNTALTQADITAIYNNAMISSVTLSVTATSSTICAGDNSTLTVSGANSYTWNTGATTSSIIATPSVTSTYTVNGAFGVCNASASNTITVNPLPVINVNSGAICTGNSFTITSSGANTYTYSSGSTVVTPTANTSYSVSGTDANGCIGNSISSVSVNPLPMVMANTSNTLLCSGQTATLSVSGITSYTWSTLENTASIAVSPTTTTTYTVNGTDANGCAGSTSISQSVSLCTDITGINGTIGMFNVYPNPTTGTFIIELTTNSQINITNALGQVIYTGTKDAGKHYLDIQNQSTGIYYVKVIQQDKQHIIKLIKD